MRWHLLIILIVLSTFAGCRGTRQRDVWQSVLDAEKRALEDRAYDLQAEVDTLESQLASTRRENDALRNELDDSPATTRANRSQLRGSGTDRSSTPLVPDEPIIELNESSPAEQLPRSNPTFINAATGRSAFTSTPTREQQAAEEASQALLSIGNLGALGGQKPTAPATDRVVSIALNPMLTGGDDLDNTPGDEGVSVVIEPKNAEGIYVPQAGSVSVVVLDPAKTGTSARVARWDFDIGEATSHLRTSALGRGIHLNLPWPNKPPEHERLHLFVRYVTADQRRLEADCEISVDLVGKISARWTPAAPTGTGRANASPQLTSEQPTPSAPVTSPYASRLKTPVATPAPTPKEPLENHRIDIAQREEEQPTPPVAEKKLEKPQWKPFR